jgi:acyl carrier protein
LTPRATRLDDPPTLLLDGVSGGCTAVDVAAELRRSISRICGIPADAVTDDATLGDLGFDSLAAAEVLTDIEIRLDRELPVDGLRRLTEARTVGDVVVLLRDQLARPAG